MKIKFSELPDRLKYPPSIKAVLSTLHSLLIESAASQYVGTFKQRQRIIGVMNTVSAHILNGDSISLNREDVLRFIDELEVIDDTTCRSILKDIYISERDVIWDIQPAQIADPDPPRAEPAAVTPINYTSLDAQPTPKEDLYLRPPTIPQMDIKHPWKAALIDDVPYVIYPSYPEIPKRQNEISCTTDVSKMTSVDLCNLFPNRFIPTRSSSMYEYTPTLSYHEFLGNIIPVAGYTESQLIDNLIKYPHIFRLTRFVDNEFVSFYSHIEIDGQLYPVADAWRSLPESSKIPFTLDYVKEYVVRRYLLERDISHVEHKYPLFGTLDPFLTLFMPATSYASLGYTDAVALAKQCVISRVSYKQSRNPILRRISDA